MRKFLNFIGREVQYFIEFVSQVKIAITAIVILALVSAIHIAFTYEIVDRDAEISSLENTILTYYVPQEEEYTATLGRITEYIGQTDSFLNVGGRGQQPEYFDPLIYNSIIRGEFSNFNEMLASVEYFFDERTEYLEQIPNIWPIEYSRLMRVTSPFGPRFSPFTGKLQNHEGIDIVSTWQADVLATAEGIVVEHWIHHPIFGKYIILQHGDLYRTHYAHLSVSYVHERDRRTGNPMEIERGQVIGRLGNTGASDGMHLHYAIQEWNSEAEEWVWIDPEGFLMRAVGDEQAPIAEIEETGFGVGGQ